MIDKMLNSILIFIKYALIIVILIALMTSAAACTRLYVAGNPEWQVWLLITFVFMVWYSYLCFAFWKTHRNKMRIKSLEQELAQTQEKRDREFGGQRNDAS